MSPSHFAMAGPRLNPSPRLDRLRISLTGGIWIHAYFSAAVWGGGSARCRNSPYRQVAGAREF